MSNTIFNKAFAVELSHAFYDYAGAPAENKFRISSGFEIAPTKECAELMKRGRLRFNRTARGFMLYYQAYKDASNTEVPFVKLSDDSEFVFSIGMDAKISGLMLNTTDLDLNSKTYTGQKLLMLEKTVGNTSNPETVTLDASLADMLRPPVFSMFFKPDLIPAYNLDADVVVYVGTSTTEAFRLDGVPFDVNTGGYAAEIDLSDQPKGFYTLKAYKAGLSAPTDVVYATDLYVDADLAARPTFGIIRIKYGEIDRLYDAITTDPNKIKTFGYEFSVRTTYWRYYAVLQDEDLVDFVTHDLLVKDTRGTPVAFTSTGQPESTFKVNGRSVVVMKTNTKLPFSESVITTFKMYKRLKASPNTETDIFLPLANAQSDGVCSDRLSAAAGSPQANDISEIFVIV